MLKHFFSLSGAAYPELLEKESKLSNFFGGLEVVKSDFISSPHSTRKTEQLKVFREAVILSGAKLFDIGQTIYCSRKRGNCCVIAQGSVFLSLSLSLRRPFSLLPSDARAEIINRAELYKSSPSTSYDRAIAASLSGLVRFSQSDINGLTEPKSAVNVPWR